MKEEDNMIKVNTRTNVDISLPLDKAEDLVGALMNCHGCTSLTSAQNDLIAELLAQLHEKEIRESFLRE